MPSTTPSELPVGSDPGAIRSTALDAAPARRTGPHRHARRLWGAAYLLVLVVPLMLSLAVGRIRRETMLVELSLAAGLAALSLLVVAFVLPSRIRALTAHLGIEHVLRAHRVVAVGATLAVLAHAGLVLATDPHHLGMLDLVTAPGRVRAASVATVALVVMTVLAATRRRRRPRYEGWRLVHIVLATTVVVGTGLHVWWLRNLVDRPLTRMWFAALSAVLLGLAAHRWVWRPLRLLRRSYVVADVRRESPTAVRLVLDARGHSGVAFRPGQFAWLKFGRTPFAFEEHPFTIASSATSPERKEFTIKALGDLTTGLDRLHPGSHVWLDGPHGRFTLDGLEAPGFVFVAGGVGITPMLSMLRTLAARGDTRHHTLVVGGRQVDELLHRDEIAALRAVLDLSVVEVVSDPDPAWTGRTGYVSREVLDECLPAGRSRRRRHYFLCGPPPMVAAGVVALDALGVPRRHVHTEQFDMV